MGRKYQVISADGHPVRNAIAFARYSDPPELHERVLQTFCGT